MIKKYFVTKQPRDGYPFDARAKKFFSWGFDFRAGGTRYQERGFLTKLEAEDAVAHIKAQAKASAHGMVKRTRTPLLIELFQKKLDEMTGPDRVRAKRVFQTFLDLLPKQIKVIDLKTAHFKTYGDKRAAVGISAATIRRELVPILAALNNAGEYFEALENYRPPKIRRPQISKTRKSKTISGHERKQILDWLFNPNNDTGRGLMRRTGQFLRFCLLTSSRPGEIASLKWSDIDFLSMTVLIAGTKTKNKSTRGVRQLAISPTMEEILKQMLAENKGEFVFTRGGKVTGKMYDALKAACEASGIDYGRDKSEGITFHRSRHTAITELIHSGVDIQTAGAIAGHSDQTMTMYYGHNDPAAIKKAMLELDDLMNIG